MATPARHMDHSLMYRELKLRNIPHRLRLRRIVRMLKSAGIDGGSWADVGCSNAYIIGQVLEEATPAEVCGFDHLESHIKAASERVPSAQFSLIDLNLTAEPERRFDVVSCFETLEHVGNLRNAITQLVMMCEPSGRLIITVPVEIGAAGLLKYAIKRVVYRYKLSELPDGDRRGAEYTKALLTGRRISTFRSDGRPGWGTHFGFDWRDVEDILAELGVGFSVRSDLFTRYYDITPLPVERA